MEEVSVLAKERLLAEDTKVKKSRSGVAIKSFEGGQMPLFRRLPKRGFKSVNRQNIAILNLSNLQTFHDQKRLNLQDNLDLKSLQNKKDNFKKYQKLKILVLVN